MGGPRVKVRRCGAPCGATWPPHLSSGAGGMGAGARLTRIVRFRSDLRGVLPTKKAPANRRHNNCLGDGSGEEPLDGYRVGH